MESDDMRDIWRSQGGANSPIGLEELRQKAGKFRSTIARRNLREYAAMILMVPYFSYFAWTSRLPLMRAGNGLIVAGLVFMGYELHRRASASPWPAGPDWESCLVFHRAQLERQRDALTGIWKWYIGPMAPGIATVCAAISLPMFRKSLHAGLLSLTWIAVPAVVLGMVARLNKNAAAKIQRQIDELESISGRDQ
ncbi:MAG TPA: hypothetical protein VMB03_08490 [Bryobacteraceae bacterium]|nr:hypothetical protein [Bryobacteraceae bacterium]